MLSKILHNHWSSTLLCVNAHHFDLIYLHIVKHKLTIIVLKTGFKSNSILHLNDVYSQ